ARSSQARDEPAEVPLVEARATPDVLRGGSGARPELVENTSLLKTVRSLQVSSVEDADQPCIEPVEVPNTTGQRLRRHDPRHPSPILVVNDIYLPDPRVVQSPYE